MAGGGPRCVVELVDYGIECRIEAFDQADCDLHQLLRGDLFGAHKIGECKPVAFQIRSEEGLGHPVAPVSARQSCAGRREERIEVGHLRRSHRFLDRQRGT